MDVPETFEGATAFFLMTIGAAIAYVVRLLAQLFSQTDARLEKIQDERFDALKARIDCVEAENANLLDRITKLAAEIKYMGGRSDELEKQNKALRESEQAAQRLVGQLQSQVASLTTERNAQNARIDTLLESLKAANEVNEQAQKAAATKDAATPAAQDASGVS